MRLIIVSGRSGSGKSTALDVLEDNGYYCIDNLPAGLLPELAERALIHTELAQPLVAVSIGIIVLGEAAGAPVWAIIAFVIAAAAAIWGVLSLSRHHPQALANTSFADAAESSINPR